MEHKREREENHVLVGKKTSLAEKISMKRKSRILFLFFNELWLNRFERIKNSEEILFMKRRNSFKTTLLCHIDLVTPRKTKESFL